MERPIKLEEPKSRGGAVQITDVRRRADRDADDAQLLGATRHASNRCVAWKDAVGPVLPK